MKAHLPKITHAAALGVGLLASYFIGRQSAASSTAGTGSAGTSRGGAAPIHETAGGGAADGTRRKPPRLRAAEYQKAWDAIVDQELPAHLRAFLQRQLLEQWAEVDLEGALTAAFGTAWDNDGYTGGIQGLLTAFNKEFARRPTEAWDLITSGKFGLGAALAKVRWAEVVVEDNPMLVANYIGQIPLAVRRSVFPRLLEAVKKDPSQIGPFYDKLGTLPQDRSYIELVRNAITALGARGGPDEIRTKFLEASTDGERSILVHEFGRSLSGASMAAISAQLNQLPEESRSRMLRSVTIHGNPGAETPQLVEMLLRSGDYTGVQAEAGEHMRKYAQDPAQRASLANWALGLSQDPGATQVVQRSAAHYITGDPQGARAWLESAADGWARNVALAEYARHMSEESGNPGASSWAVAQISDPAIQKGVINRRTAWEKRRKQ